LVCSNMPSQPGHSLQHLFDGPTHRNRHTHLCQIVVQLRLHSCTCLLPSPGFVLFLAAQGFATCQVANTGTGSMQVVSDRINTREQACTYIPLCFVALIVQCAAARKLS
jgi:hypothetical protein